jgi:hypothetical protein
MPRKQLRVCPLRENLLSGSFNRFAQLSVLTRLRLSSRNRAVMLLSEAPHNPPESDTEDEDADWRRESECGHGRMYEEEGTAYLVWHCRRFRRFD